MNSSESERHLSQAAEEPLTAIRDVQEQFNQLRYLFILALASIVLVCMAVCVFMGKQWRTVKAQLEDQRPTIQSMWTEYGKTTEPLIRDFVRSLQTYSAQHRDFQPILDKHRKQLDRFLLPVSSAPAPAQPPPSR